MRRLLSLLLFLVALGAVAAWGQSLGLGASAHFIDKTIQNSPTTQMTLADCAANVVINVTVTEAASFLHLPLSAPTGTTCNFLLTGDYTVYFVVGSPHEFYTPAGSAAPTVVFTQDVDNDVTGSFLSIVRLSNEGSDDKWTAVSRFGA